MAVLLMIRLSNVSVADLLPVNLKSDYNVLSAAVAIDEELKKITSSIANLQIYNRLDDLSTNEVDELAWQFHVDFYSPELPIDTRKALIFNSFRWHKNKGTKQAVEGLINTIFGDGEVKEWFEFGGQPGTYRIVSSNEKITNEQADQFIDALSTVTRLSAFLDSIQITMVDTLPLKFAGIMHTGEYMTIREVV